MANWYALAGDQYGNDYDIAYMIPIPAGNNLAGLAWQSVIISSGIGGKSTVPSSIMLAADLTAIQNGSVYEYHEPFFANPTFTAAQLSSQVTARRTALVPIVQGKLQSELQFFGGNG